LGIAPPCKPSTRGDSFFVGVTVSRKLEVGDATWRKFKVGDSTLRKFEAGDFSPRKLEVGDTSRKFAAGDFMSRKLEVGVFTSRKLEVGDTNAGTSVVCLLLLADLSRDLCPRSTALLYSAISGPDWSSNIPQKRAMAGDTPPPGLWLRDRGKLVEIGGGLKTGRMS
jgi:hypothetical protein